MNSHSRFLSARHPGRTFLLLLLLGVLTVMLAPAPSSSAASSASIKLAVGNDPLAGWWPDTYWVTTGTPVAAVVTGSEARVVLQKRTALGLWVMVSAKTFTAEETVRIAVPLDQRVTRPVHTQMWRFFVQAGNFKGTMAQNFRVIGQPVAPPPDSLQNRAVGIAAPRWDRFNPCAPITWAMDVRRSPYGRLTSIQTVHYVISTLRAKTGLNFVFKGHVTHSGDPKVRSAHMLTIVWGKTNGAASDRRWMRGSAFLGLTKGTAVISATKIPLSKARIVLFHEIMHVLGAAHSQSSADMMYSAVIGQRAFGAGDLAILKQVDARNTCF